jgi:Fur family ferric uptake transcriptional regulator
MISLAVLEQRLARSGYRLTRPRRSLLGAMQQLGDHFTAGGLLAITPVVGRATVFRTLRLLQDIGALCQVVLGDGTIEYRLTSGGHHHHMVCSDCGAVTDFAACELQESLARLAERTGYDVSSHRLEVYGRCAQCQLGEAAASPPPAVRSPD